MSTALLWHGTSDTIANHILNEGIAPNGTESLSHLVSDAGTLGAARTDKSLVYLMQHVWMAIPFGWARAAGRIENGYLKADITSRNRVAVFAIDSDVLNSEALVRGTGNVPKSEIAYRGTIPATALCHVIYFPVSGELATFSREVLNGELQKYRGIDLLAHLRGKQFDICADALASNHEGTGG